MISPILSKKTCRDCRFCCVFKRTSRHELPLLTGGAGKRITQIFPEVRLTPINATTDAFSLQGEYETDDPHETLPCPFLKDGVGCQLGEKEKPLECKIWPFRVMVREGRTILALCAECPGIEDREAAFAYAKGPLRDALRAIAKTETLVKQPYRDNYIEVCEL